MNSLHYYPYASFTNDQLPLLKATALYFDKLHILDPFQASWDTVGAGAAINEVAFLRNKGLLTLISPAEVLKRYESPITKAIRADVNDPEFLQICENYSRHKRWTLALAKVPKEIRNDPQYKPLDESMKTLMGDFSRELAHDAGQYQEDYFEYTEAMHPYDEYREIFGGHIEYRYVDYPLALGESIMINHALFASLLHAEATPITDDPFHQRVLEYKIGRVVKNLDENPVLRQVIEDRFRSLKLKRDFFANYVLTDQEIKLPALSDQLPLEAIYEHREHHKDELAQARQKINQLARSIKAMPLTDDFRREVDAAMSGMEKEIEEVKKARDAWLKSQRGRMALKGTGIVAGAAAVTLSLTMSVEPIANILLLITGLGLLKEQLIPAAELLLDWNSERADAMDNGLSYFMKLK